MLQWLGKTLRVRMTGRAVLWFAAELPALVHMLAVVAWASMFQMALNHNRHLSV
jgi:hypothetical protein